MVLIREPREQLESAPEHAADFRVAGGSGPHSSAKGSAFVATAKQGDTVHVHYTGRFDDGTIFDTSEGGKPLELTLGEGRIIPGFEKAVEGLAEGEKKAARVPPEEAYGRRSDELVMRIQRDLLPQDSPLSIGQRLEMTTRDGRKVPVTVTQTSEKSVVVDANHPLAGKELTFDLELVKIV